MTKHAFAMNIRRAVGIATTVVLTSTIPTPAQSLRIGTVDAVEGSVIVTRRAVDSPLALKSDVLAQDRITTGSQSMAQIGFTAEFTVVLSERSAMTISEAGGTPVLNLDHGMAHYRVSGAVHRVDEVRTPNAIARTTGGLLVRVDRASGTVLVTTVCVLEGNGSAETLDGTKIELPERECVRVSGTGLGTVFPLPPTPEPIPLTHYVL